jgi:hypothetical protein
MLASIQYEGLTVNDVQMSSFKPLVSSKLDVYISIYRWPRYSPYHGGDLVTGKT